MTYQLISDNILNVFRNKKQKSATFSFTSHGFLQINNSQRQQNQKIVLDNGISIRVNRNVVVKIYVSIKCKLRTL